MFGPATQFFEEGTAVALGGDDYGPPSYTGALNLLDWQPSDSRYATAGDFVSYLLKRFGPDQLRQLLMRTPRKLSPSDAAAVFAEVYGESMDQAIADRQTSSDNFEGDWTETAYWEFLRFSGANNSGQRARP